MAAGTFTLYSRNKDNLNIDDLLAATVKVALVDSSYTPDTDPTTGHDTWSDVSADEIANGNGYTTGGATVGSDVATAISGGFKYASANVAWTASGGAIPAWRTAVMYVSGTLWGMTDPVIGYFLGDNAPADIPATSDGSTLTLTCPTDGWFDVT